MTDTHQVPSIGRMIHVVRRGIGSTPIHKPAVIEEVDGDEFSVTAFVNGTTTLMRFALVDQDPTGQRIYSWHWPERVP